MNERREGREASVVRGFEVAGESLQRDRLTKAAVYAAAGIPEYVTLARGQAFESSAVPGFAFRVASLFE